MANLQMPKCCPKCKRLTVHNKQHCDLVASRWAIVCRWIKCQNTHCRWTYGPENGRMVGFYPDGKAPVG